MKKILSLLSAIALTTSASATVIACGSKFTDDQKVMDAIVKKITKKDLVLVSGTDPSTTNKKNNYCIEKQHWKL